MRVSPAVVRMLAGALLLVVVLAAPAGAHDPIFVDDRTPPADSPIIRDGTISFATYGMITEAGGASHLRLDLADGDTLHVEVLVPDQPPENGLGDFGHLSLTVAAPDGSVVELPGADVINRYDEPFTDTAYLRVAELDAPAVAGTYELTVTATRPTRFTVATGRTERFGTDVANYERRSLDAVGAWYATPPPETAPATTAAPTPTAAPPPPPPESTPPPPTTTVVTTTSVAPSAEAEDLGAEVAAAPTEPSDEPGDGVTAAVLVLGAVGLAGGGWWLWRRRSQT